LTSGFDAIPSPESFHNRAMGQFDRQQPKFCHAFTRLELAVVLGCVSLLGLLVLPMLGRSHSAAGEAVCMNNLRNLGRAFLVYSDQNKGYVPEEGNLVSTIVATANAYAWYNVAVQPEYPSIKNLYVAGNFPLPGNGSIYSCPAALNPPVGQPSFAWAFFMYGENNRLCVNQSTRTASGQAVQTRFSTIPRPAATIMIGELDDDFAVNSGIPANSGVFAPYVVARHDGFGLSTMCDGSVGTFTTNQFIHANSSAAQEWYSDGNSSTGGYTSWPVYWYPTPTILN
jgi:type II secretory pathway pseudopilin PulG